MTLDDLKRLFLSPTLFRLDTILAPRLVPLLYAAGLGALLLWGVSHLVLMFSSSFFNGLWGLFEIVVFGLLWLIVLRVVCEALAVFFKSHEAAVERLSRTRLPAPLLEDVADAIHDLADDVDPPRGESPIVDPAPHIIRPGPTPLPPDVPVRGSTVRRTAKRTPPAPPPGDTGLPE